MCVLIKNVNIVYPKKNHAVEKHDVYIKKNTVLGFDLKIKCKKIIDGNGKTLLPAFFNVHTHLGESLYNIKLDNLTVLDYIDATNKINDKLSKQKQKQIWKSSAKQTISLMKAEHTIGYCAARAYCVHKKNNLLTMSGYPLMMSNKLKEYYEKGFEGFINSLNKYDSAFDSVGIFLHSLYYSNLEMLSLASKCFKYANFLTIHISEDLRTREMELSLYGEKPVFLLDKFGLLSEKTILVHGGYLDDDELKLIYNKKANIVMCPKSNCCLNTISVDINRLNEIGIRWMIGTDGLLTGGLSLLEQIKIIKEKYPNIKNTQLLDAITIYPAKLFNRVLYTGSITKGVKSSFILINDDFLDVEESLGKLLNGKLEVIDLNL